jgi:hypothetical protein
MQGGTQMSMTIVIPDGLEKLGESVEKLVAEVSGNVRTFKLGKTPDYRDVENSIAKRAAEIETNSHQAMLQSLDVNAPIVIIGGKEYRQVLRSEGNYYCMAGGMKVMHTLYRECGTHHGKTVDPVSLRAGVVGDGWLPLTAQAMAFQLQKGTSREAEQSARETKRLEYSRPSYERVGHLVGELYVKNHAEIEDMMIQAFEVPSEAQSISISIDRVSVPMEEPRKRPVGRPRKDAPKNPVYRNYRMAWAGTVTFHDAQGEALFTIRYGRMPQGDAVELVESLVGDVLVSLKQRPDLEVVALADGAHENWDLLGAILSEYLSDRKTWQILDLWHVLEKLGAASRVIHGTKNSKDELSRWHMMLLNSSSAASRILAELKNSGCEDVFVGEKKPVHEAITYLTNHKNRMDYASARKAGLPLGSGYVEATCKSLFELRLKRPGSRWKERTGLHVVHLRALALSDRWNQAIQLALKPLTRSVRPAA